MDTITLTVTENFNPDRSVTWTARHGRKVVVRATSPQEGGMWDSDALRNAVLAHYAVPLEALSYRRSNRKGRGHQIVDLVDVKVPSFTVDTGWTFDRADFERRCEALAPFTAYGEGHRPGVDRNLAEARRQLGFAEEYLPSVFDALYWLTRAERIAGVIDFAERERRDRELEPHLKRAKVLGTAKIRGEEPPPLAA